MTAGELQTSVEQGLLAIHPAGLDDYFEIRILRHDNRVDSGYFTDAACAADAVEQHIESGVGANYYVTLNPISPARINGQRINRIERGATRTTRDADILCRRWMLVDIDPVRPVGLSSTDAELAHSRICRDAVVEWLRSQVWPQPVLAMSGNGSHALYPVDLAPDDASTERLKRVLIALAHRFNNPHATVDVTVHNLSRICKVYGTRACKGSATPDRPHRLAGLEVLP